MKNSATDEQLKLFVEFVEHVYVNGKELDFGEPHEYNDKKYLTNIEPVVDTFHGNYGDHMDYLLQDYVDGYNYNPNQTLFYNPSRTPELCGQTHCGYSFMTLEEDQYDDLKVAGETLKEHAYDAREGLTSKISWNLRTGQFGKDFKQQGIDIDPYITELQKFYNNMDDDEREQLNDNIKDTSLSISYIDYNDDLKALIKSFEHTR